MGSSSQTSAKWKSPIQQPQELVATSSDEQHLTTNSVSVAADTHTNGVLSLFLSLTLKFTIPFQFCTLRFPHQGKAIRISTDSRDLISH